MDENQLEMLNNLKLEVLEIKESLADDYLTKSEIESGYINVDDAVNYALNSSVAETYETKIDASVKYNNVLAKINNKMDNVDLSVYVKNDVLDSTKSYFDTRMSSLESDIDGIRSSVISDAYTKDEINGMGFLTQHQSLENYVTIDWVEEQNFAKTNNIPDMSPYATREWVDGCNFLTEHQSLVDYAKMTDIPTNLSQFVNDLGFVTEKSMSIFAKKTDLSGLLAKTDADSKYLKISDFVLPSDLVRKSDIVDLVNKSTLSDEYVSLSQFNNMVSNYGFITSDEVKNQYVKNTVLGNYLTVSNANDTYLKKTDINLVESLKDYAKKSEIPNLTGYVTGSYLSTNFYTKTYSDSTFVTKNDLNSHISNNNNVTSEIYKKFTNYVTTDAFNVASNKNNNDISQKYLTKSMARATYLTIEDFRSLKDAAILNTSYNNNPDSFFSDLNATTDAPKMFDGIYVLNGQVFIVANRRLCQVRDEYNLCWINDIVDTNED